MAEDKKKKDDAPEDQGNLPGSPEWERNRQVIHGEVDPTSPDKTNPAFDGDEAKDKD